MFDRAADLVRGEIGTQGAGALRKMTADPARQAGRTGNDLWDHRQGAGHRTILPAGVSIRQGTVVTMEDGMLRSAHIDRTLPAHPTIAHRGWPLRPCRRGRHPLAHRARTGCALIRTRDLSPQSRSAPAGV